jgi:hypothetical protein
MANYTTNLQELSQSQGGKEATINKLFDAASQSMLGGRKESSVGLAWDYYGGNMFASSGAVIAVANGTLTLTNTATNYIEIDQAGTVTANTSAFTEGRTKLYSVVCAGGVVTGYTDYRINFNSLSAYNATVTSTSNTPTITQAHYGKILLWSPTGGGSFTLPANGATAGAWFEVVLLTDQTITMSAATADTLITRGDLTADSVAFSTGGEKIGAAVKFLSNGTYWIAINKSDCTMTVNT